MTDRREGPLRIAWVSHNSDIGGAELCLIEAAVALAPFGFESEVLLPWHGEIEEPLGRHSLPVHVRLYRWWVARGPDRAYDLRVRRALRTLSSLPGLVKDLRRINPDVVISNTLATPAGAMAARVLGIPHIWYIHELGAEDMRLPFDWGDQLSGRLMNWWSDGAIAVSYAVQEKFSQWFPKDRLPVVYNAVEVPFREPVPLSPGGPLRMVVMGAKHPGKRQADAIRAVRLLVDRGVDCRLTLGGREDEEYGRQLRSLVQELALEEHVEVKRFVPDAFEEMERAHVFVMPSQSEAFGRVTIEAMKLGRAVVGTNRAGTAEFIRDGWNGLLYPPEDVEALADRLEYLNDNRELLEEMGRNARSWATDRCRPDRYAREMDDAIRLLVGP